MLKLSIGHLEHIRSSRNVESSLVSVIVPVYNVEKYLPRCLDSLINQTYENLEILIVDDGSSDLSSDICDVYATKDSRIRVFHIPNGGVSNARNLALDNMTGEYVTFVDSDDWLEVNWIENALFEVKSTDVSLYIGGYVKNYPNLSEKVVHKYMPRSVLTRLECLKEMYMKPPDETAFLWEVCGKLFDSHLWKDVRFASSISVQEDGLAFWHVLQTVDKVLYVPKYNYHYFCRENSAVNTIKARYIFDSFSVDKALWKESEKIMDTALRDALKVRFFNSRIYCLLMLSWCKYYSDEMFLEKKLFYKDVFLHFWYAVKAQGMKGALKVLLAGMPSFVLKALSKRFAQTKGLDISKV